MRKKELVFLHGLLTQVRAFREARGAPVEAAAYDRLGVAPTALHRPKDDHREAVLALARALADGAEAKTES